MISTFNESGEQLNRNVKGDISNILTEENVKYITVKFNNSINVVLFLKSENKKDISIVSIGTKEDMYETEYFIKDYLSSFNILNLKKIEANSFSDILKPKYITYDLYRTSLMKLGYLEFLSRINLNGYEVVFRTNLNLMNVHYDSIKKELSKWSSLDIDMLQHMNLNNNLENLILFKEKLRTLNIHIKPKFNKYGYQKLIQLLNIIPNMLNKTSNNEVEYYDILIKSARYSTNKINLGCISISPGTKKINVNIAGMPQINATRSNFHIIEELLRELNQYEKYTIYCERLKLIYM